MRILFCVNWIVDQKCTPEEAYFRFRPDYKLPGHPYWFFKHLREKVEVDILDRQAPLGFDRIERKLVHFYPSKGIHAWIRSRRYDLVLSHGGQIGLVIALLQSLFPSKSQPPHVMIDVGGMSGSSWLWNNKVFIASCRFAARSLAANICHNSNQIDIYRNNYPGLAKKTHFIPLGVDTDEFKPRNCSVENKIICVGYSRMDIELLISAYAKLKTETRLVLLGVPEGYTSDVSGVECLPQVGIEEMRTLIAKSRLVVLPLPNVDYCIGQQRLLQSMALGKTVLTSNIAAVRDYVEDGETATLYEADNVDSLSLKLKELLASYCETEQIGANARIAVESRYSELIMARRIFDLLNQVITG
jgi:glycosyltransferase involved in cell wall biosynthesis